MKGSHSILRDLEDLRDLNVRVAQLGAIAAQQMDQVSAAIDEAWTQATGSPNQPWSIDDPDDVRRLADSMYAQAREFAGAAFTTYCRLKVEAAGERLADEIVARFVYPPGSGRTTFIRAALAAWARGRIEWREPDPSRLLQMLGPVDVPYRERRLMFILAGINALYSVADSGPHSPRRTELDALKAKAWELLDDLHAAPRDAVGAVTDSSGRLLGRGPQRRRGVRQSRGVRGRARRRLHRALHDLPRQPRRAARRQQRADVGVVRRADDGLGRRDPARAALALPRASLCGTPSSSRPWRCRGCRSSRRSR